jgi:hypothetical protein
VPFDVDDAREVSGHSDGDVLSAAPACTATAGVANCGSA